MFEDGRILTDPLFHKPKEQNRIINRLSSVVEFIDNHFAEDIALKDLALQCYLCPAYFIREFKKEYNVSPYRYLINRRLDEAKELLYDKKITIKEICNKVGYEDICSFSKLFKRRFGLSPESFRKTLDQKENACSIPPFS
jgi:AraC-like DNA-binding protein